MAYTNRIPLLSRTDKTIRDNDFIPITELKDFDARLDEVVQKFSVANSSDSATAVNIGQKIKDIEYNMADALLFDEKGNIIGYNNKLDEYTGETIADQGPDSMDNLVSQLEVTYNEFVKLLGGDETKDNWKYELDRDFNEALTSFKGKIDSIFKRSINAQTIEAKENTDYNYTHKNSVKLDDKSVMRLNPDNLSYTRTISVSPRNLEEELVIFEVQELETKNLVLNMKVSNGSMYYNYNIIIDNDVLHISKEEHIKLNDYMVTINIYKYTTASNETRYVFTLISTEPIANADSYEFELTGILVSQFDFRNTGFPLESHDKYFEYVKVPEEVLVPDYNTIYYTIDHNNYIESSKTVERHSEEPTIEEKKDHFIITTTTTEVVTEKKAKKNEASRDSYIEHTHLKEFEKDKVYYIKKCNFTFYDKFVINDDKTEGMVDNSNIDQNNKPYIIDNQQTLVNTKKYINDVGVKTVDVDCGELYGPSYSIETMNPSVELVRPDSGVNFQSPIDGTIIETRTGPLYNNGNLMIGYGSKAIELMSIKPNEAVCIEPIITEKRANELGLITENVGDPKEIDISLSSKDPNDVLTLTEYTRSYNNRNITIQSGLVESYSIYTKNSLLNDLIKIDDESNTSILKVLQQQLRFVDCFEIDPNIQIINKDLIDIKIYCDNIHDYLYCMHIYFNTSKKEIVNVPKIHKILSDITNSIDLTDLPAKPKTLCSNHLVTLAILDWEGIENPTYDVYISYNGIKFFKSPEMSKYKFTNVIWDDAYTFIAWSDITKKIYMSTIGYGNWIEVPIELAEDEIINKIISTDMNRYFVLTNHSIYFSENLESFTKMNGLANTKYFDLVCNGNVYVTTGTGDNRYRLEDSKITEEIMTWTKASTPLGVGLTEEQSFCALATYENKGFTAVGPNGIIYSETGDVWTVKEQIDATKNIGYDSVISCYAVDNSSPIIYGKTFAYAKNTNRFNISSDYGETWIDIEEDKVLSFSDDGLAYNNSTPNINKIYWTGKTEERKAIIITDKAIYLSTSIECIKFDKVNIVTTPEDKAIDILDFPTLCLANITDDYNECYDLGGTINNKPIIIHSKECKNWNIISKDSPIRITSLNDIKMDNKNYIMGTANNSICYDDIDGVFVTNGLDKNRNLKYKSFDYKGVSTTFGFGSGTGKTYVVNKTNGDVITDINLEIDNMFEISGAKSIIKPINDSDRFFKSDDITDITDPNKNLTSYIFGIPGDSTKGLILFNFDEDTNITNDKFTNYKISYKNWSPTTTSTALDDYICEELYETSKGLFIKCRKEYEKVIPAPKPALLAAEEPEKTDGEQVPSDTEPTEPIPPEETVDPVPGEDSGSETAPLDPSPEEGKGDGDEITDPVLPPDESEGEGTVEPEPEPTVTIKVKEAHILFCAYKENPDFDNCVLYEDPVDILKTDYIDCVYVNSDELIVSTYDKENIARKWRFDTKTNKFVSLDINDLNHIYSFNKVIKYNNELFIYNGSGIMGEITKSLTGEIIKNNFKRGVVRLKKVYTTYGAEDNGFYDVDFLIDDDNAQYGKETPLFIVGNVLYAYINKKLYKYNIDSLKFEEATDDVLTESLVNNIFAVEDASFKSNLDIVIQDTMNGNSKINTYNIGVNDPEYTMDKIYFDSENGLITNKYKINNNQIAISKRLNSNHIDLVLALAKDCKLAIYDKELDILKTCDLKFTIIGQDSNYVDLNPNYQTLEYIGIGTTETKSTLYILIDGQFPNVSVEDGKTNISYENTPHAKKLFELDDITALEAIYAGKHTSVYLNENTELSVIKGIDDVISYIEHKNLDIHNIKSNKYVDGKLFIGSINNIAYDNANSLVFWNDATSSIDFITKNNWDTNIDDVNILKDYYSEIPLIVDEANKRSYRLDKTNGKELEIVEYPGINSNFVRVGKESYLCGTSLNTASNPSKANINVDLGIDNLQQTEFGALAWGIKNTKGDVIYNPNECNNLHYIIKTDGTIMIDQFTSNGDRYYNKAKQTRLGLFRWYDFADSKLNEGVTKPAEYSKTSEDYNTGFCYFTPRNSSTIVKITPGPGKYIYKIFDTYEGTFIAVKDYRWYGVDQIVDTVEFWSLYRVVGIPVDSEQRISFDDERYFERCDCYDNKVTNLFDTQYGLFAVARIEADDRNSVEAQSIILRWNGEDFYKVMDNDYPIIDMIDSSEGLFFFTDESPLVDNYKIGDSITIPSFEDPKSKKIYENVKFICANKSNGNDIFISEKIIPDSMCILATTITPEAPSFGETADGIAYAEKLDGYISTMLNTNLLPYKRTYDNHTSEEKVFLPLEYEVAGSSEYSNDKTLGSSYSQWKLFKDNPKTKIKTYNGEKSTWWLANYNTDKSGLVAVSDSGETVQNPNSNKTAGLALSFCIKTLKHKVVPSTYVWDNKNNKVVQCGETAPYKHDPQIGGICHNDYFGSQKNNLDSDFGSILFGRGKVAKLSGYYTTKDISYQEIPGYGPCTLQVLRVYNAKRSEGNLTNIAKYLANDLGLPVDVNIKLVGNIMYNGFQVPVSGLKIFSKDGVSKEPYSVKFTIDKDARFTYNEKTIKNIVNTEDVIGPDIGTITDYDPDNKVYNSKPIIISKMNFTAFYNN